MGGCSLEGSRLYWLFSQVLTEVSFRLGQRSQNSRSLTRSISLLVFSGKKVQHYRALALSSLVFISPPGPCVGNTPAISAIPGFGGLCIQGKLYACSGLILVS